ncbi:hypothetical protein DPMN_044800 [Dreissena polymorpha]|uniref:Uncharacterized protein n=1 Tax=Dreissena polymorpha TaxID=45954 RepID=A0A9D4HZ99_DREPO|nr:hypothetical protein DPMN_044800 [Dreissena polymorpha]
MALDSKNSKYSLNCGGVLVTAVDNHGVDEGDGCRLVPVIPHYLIEEIEQKGDILLQTNTTSVVGYTDVAFEPRSGKTGLNTSD